MIELFIRILPLHTSRRFLNREPSNATSLVFFLRVFSERVLMCNGFAFVASAIRASPWNWIFVVALIEFRFGLFAHDSTLTIRQIAQTVHAIKPNSRIAVSLKTDDAAALASALRLS